MKKTNLARAQQPQAQTPPTKEGLMRTLHPDIAIGVLVLGVWLLAFQGWWSQNIELKRHSPERFNRRLAWWLVAVGLIIGVTVVYHTITHGFKPLWL